MKNKGIIPINKPESWTSFDVVNKIKYAVKPLKVGHLGTLDPMATGVLLVTIGKATKLFDLMQEKEKTYVATFKFGFETDTLDATGEIINKCDVLPTKQQIVDILPKFIGKISQIPPKYSAKSVNGRRAYDMARKGVEFELKPKIVDINNIVLLDFTNNELKLEITCGSGTYIRAIGRDIAKELNTFATMTSLVRTKVGSFSLDKCKNIKEITENIDENIVPIKEILNYPILNLDEISKNRLLNGQKLEINAENGLYQIIDNFDTLALIKINENLAKMYVFLG